MTYLKHAKTAAVLAMGAMLDFGALAGLASARWYGDGQWHEDGRRWENHYNGYNYRPPPVYYGIALQLRLPGAAGVLRQHAGRLIDPALLVRTRDRRDLAARGALPAVFLCAVQARSWCGPGWRGPSGILCTSRIGRPYRRAATFFAGFARRFITVFTASGQGTFIGCRRHRQSAVFDRLRARLINPLMEHSAPMFRSFDFQEDTPRDIFVFEGLWLMSLVLSMTVAIVMYDDLVGQMGWWGRRGSRLCSSVVR